MENLTCPSCGHLVASANIPQVVIVGGDLSLGATTRLFLKLALAAIPAIMVLVIVSVLLLLVPQALLWR